MKMLRNFTATIALTLAPMTAMAITPNNADACFQCGTGTQVCKCVPAFEGSLSCLPEPGICQKGDHCTLSGSCL